MHKELKEFYREINNGQVRGSRKIVADALGINETAVSKWNSGITKPSEENIAKLAKIFKKSKEEIERIFVENINCRPEY